METPPLITALVSVGGLLPRVNASGPPCRLVIIVSGATLLSLFTEDVNSVAV